MWWTAIVVAFIGSVEPTRHSVAVLIGSWFNVSLNQQGHNLRANLLEPLKADLHLQLTYRSDDGCNSTESCGLAERFSGLAPIAQIHLERQRTIEVRVRGRVSVRVFGLTLTLL